MYNWRQLWNKNSCYRYCRVYNTLKQSGFWLRTIRELMADLTTINASIRSTTFVELVFSELYFSLVPRGVALRAWCSFLVLYFFITIVRLQRTFKVCFCVLKIPPRNFTAKNTFTAVTSKNDMTAMTVLTNVAVRTLVRWHRHKRLIHDMCSSGTTISRNIYGSQAPQTILSNIILQSNQRYILACLPIGH